MCIYVYTYIHIYMYTHTHTHTHIHIGILNVFTIVERQMALYLALLQLDDTAGIYSQKSLSLSLSVSLARARARYCSSMILAYTLKSPLSCILR